jgi:hypothetical protein
MVHPAGLVHRAIPVQMVSMEKTAQTGCRARLEHQGRLGLRVSEARVAILVCRARQASAESLGNQDRPDTEGSLEFLEIVAIEDSKARVVVMENLGLRDSQARPGGQEQQANQVRPVSPASRDIQGRMGSMGAPAPAASMARQGSQARTAMQALLESQG